MENINVEKENTTMEKRSTEKRSMKIIDEMLKKYEKRGKYTPAGAVDIRKLCKLIENLDWIITDIISVSDMSIKYRNKLVTDTTMAYVWFENNAL